VHAETFNFDLNFFLKNEVFLFQTAFLDESFFYKNDIFTQFSDSQNLAKRVWQCSLLFLP